MATAQVRRRCWQIAAATCLAVTVTAEAGFLSKLNVFKYWSGKSRVDTLMVTGNYAKSRLLAELVQSKTKQPILLIEPGTRGEEMYFLPAAPEALAVEKAKLVEFVDFLLQPQDQQRARKHKQGRVVFIGDADFVPQEFVDTLRDRFPTFIVASDNWQNNAEALAKLFRYRKLPQHYGDLLAQLAAADAQGPAPGGVTPATPEPLALPRTAVPVQ